MMSIWCFVSSRSSTPRFKDAVPSMMLLSLAGAGCVVANQAVSSITSTSVIQGTSLMFGYAIYNTTSHYIVQNY